jgi:hypothetical protein
MATHGATRAQLGVDAAYLDGIEAAARQACYLCDCEVPRHASGRGFHFHRTWRFGARRYCKASAIWGHLEAHSRSLEYRPARVRELSRLGAGAATGYATLERQARRDGTRFGTGLVCEHCKEGDVPVVQESDDGLVRPLHQRADGPALACLAHWRAILEGPQEMRNLMQFGR